VNQNDPRPLVAVALLLLASCVGEAASFSPAAPISTSAMVTLPAPPAAPPPAPAEPPKTSSDDYQPSVKVGNTTALNAARVPFAHYLNQIHNRIHPIFADEFLASLNQARSPWPPDLRTDLELVIEQTTGKLVKVGVIRASGVAPFDQAALQTVQRAQPFGPAPEIIASPDGNVYVHWEFHRDPFDACTTRNARPYLLKNAP